MNSYQKIHLRRFPVRIQDERTGEVSEDAIVISKDQLRAAQLCGQSSKELIHRAFNRQGYQVMDIGRAEKAEAVLDLDGLFEEAVD